MRQHKVIKNPYVPQVSYSYKGFVMKYGLCDVHPDRWCVRDFNNYDPALGSKPTDICETSLVKARAAIRLLAQTRKEIPF